MGLIGELKRRNVIKVSVAYLALGWLVTQITATVAPALHLPDWTLPLVVWIGVIGFPFVLLFSWVYELTPEGLKRERDVDRSASITHITGRRLDYMIIGMLALAILLFAFDQFGPSRSEKGTEVIKGEEKGSEPFSGRTASVSAPPSEPEKGSDPFTSPPERGSIAVLPFANMSPDPENEYFADGIAEELLGILSRVAGLHVASRTSSFAFKGKNQSVRDIARALNVAHVLEGSVRKQGTRVRITAQLIDAGTDKHLWSDTYDRDLSDIFRVQEEIAQAISKALGEVLGVAQSATTVKVAPPTADLDAYALYLRGRQAFFQRGAALLQARQLLEAAVARDPGFAQAWAVLAGTYYVSPDYVNLPNAEALELAERAASRARDLDGTLALPWAVLAQVAEHRSDLLESERLLGEAIARDAADPTVWLWLGLLHLEVGDHAKAEDDLKRVLEIDPLSGIAHGWYGVVLRYRGDRARGDVHLERASQFGWPAADRQRIRFALDDGDRERAALHMRIDTARFSNVAPGTRAVIDAGIAAVLDPSKSGALHAAVLADREGLNGLGWSGLLASLGMHREAIAVELDPNLPRTRTFHRILGYTTARGVWSEPTYLELAERDGLMAYWNAKGFPAGCRLVDAPERHLDCTERWR